MREVEASVNLILDPEDSSVDQEPVFAKAQDTQPGAATNEDDGIEDEVEEAQRV